MRRFFQVILVVLTISFSAFLIERSCHENTGDYAPDRSGGISQAIRPTPETQIGSASPPPAPGEGDTSEEKVAKAVSRAKPRNESTATAAPSEEPREVSAKVASVGTPRTEIMSPEVSSSAAKRTATTSAAATRAAANEKLQGTWVLSDGKTRFELTILNDSGVLKAQILEAGKSVTIEENVQVTAENDTIYVYSSGLRLPFSGITPVPRRDEPIVLAFNFDADGSPQIVWQQGRANRFTRLNVVSHVR